MNAYNLSSPINLQFVFSINVLMEDFKAFDQSAESQALITDLQTMVSGLMSMRFITNYIPNNGKHQIWKNISEDY